jgi:hypothetical protein
MGFGPFFYLHYTLASAILVVASKTAPDRQHTLLIHIAGESGRCQ